MTDGASSYSLLDAGDGRRLERFGARTVDRPAAAASGIRRGDFHSWRRADLRFDPGGWFGDAAAREPWTTAIDGLTLELRPTASGGLGVYPEHAANLSWLADRVRERAGAGREPPQVLNLFAHTGLVSLAAARAGAAVAHVDASKGAVDWARRNAELSGLDNRPIRWLVDDAAGFVAREARRGRRYHGIVLDPPSFGRAGRRQWKLEDELPELLSACRRIAGDESFVLVTVHTTGLEGEALGDLVRSTMGPTGALELVPLELRAASGASLPMGWAARLG
jgi:23S rRNA (cytosine1962-C5)-methyltransferase